MADVRVIGVDGVRRRWLGVVLDLDPAGDRPGRATWLLGTASEVLGTVTGPATGPSPGAVACGIDVPVGLSPSGQREADRQARALLGPAARSSIFATAPQPAFAVARRVGASRASRAEADAASRAAGGGGISTQAWSIADKVLEVEDAVLALGATGDRVVEVHPETTFAAMAHHFRMQPPPGKRTAAGVAERVRLLGRTLPALDVVDALARVPAARSAAGLVPVDDALDALAAACSALRHAYRQAQVLGQGAGAVWSDGSAAPGRAVIVV